MRSAQRRPTASLDPIGLPLCLLVGVCSADVGPRGTDVSVVMPAVSPRRGLGA